LSSLFIGSCPFEASFPLVVDFGGRQVDMD
jgi:hypothetical protein